MLINTIHGISVGADLSRTPPIYRPSVALHTIPLILLIHIIGLRWMLRCPNQIANPHNLSITTNKHNIEATPFAENPDDHSTRASHKLLPHLTRLACEPFS